MTSSVTPAGISSTSPRRRPRREARRRRLPRHQVRPQRLVGGAATGASAGHSRDRRRAGCGRDRAGQPYHPRGDPQGTEDFVASTAIRPRTSPRSSRSPSRASRSRSVAAPARPDRARDPATVAAAPCADRAGAIACRWQTAKCEARFSEVDRLLIGLSVAIRPQLLFDAVSSGEGRRRRRRLR